ncbi:MAG: hypothetical protein HYX60_10295 [Legionella longbeachae]|nr:hypothetical protein [Legionella longbeachae]
MLDLHKILEENENFKNKFKKYIKNNKIQTKKKLLKLINAEDELGYNLIFYAVKNNRTDVVRWLIMKGADVNQTYNGYTLKEIALRDDNEDIAAILPGKDSIAGKRYFQDSIINGAKALGYKSNKKGICFGFSHMAIQAILFKKRDEKNNLVELNVFKKRLKVIHTIREERFKQFINNAQNKRKNSRIKTEKLSPLEVKMLDIPNFFEGIEIHQQSRSYPELFEKFPQPQLAVESFPIVSPVNLDENPIVNVNHFSGVYTRNDLNDYFQTLRQALKENKCDFPIALELSCNGHSITLGYDPLLDQWIFMDANKDKICHIYDNDILINKLIRHLTFKEENKAEHFILASNIYITTEDCKQLKEILHKWQNTQNWQNMHMPTKDKTTIINEKSSDWFQIACENGDLATAKKINEHFLYHYINMIPTIPGLKTIIGLSSVCFSLLALTVGRTALPAIICSSLAIAGMELMTLFKHIKSYLSVSAAIQQKKSSLVESVCNSYSDNLYVSTYNNTRKNSHSNVSRNFSEPQHTILFNKKKTMELNINITEQSKTNGSKLKSNMRF